MVIIKDLVLIFFYSFYILYDLQGVPRFNSLDEDIIKIASHSKDMQKAHKEAKGELSSELDDLLERVVSGKEKTTSYDTPEDHLKHVKKIIKE